MPGSSKTFKVICSLAGSGWSVWLPQLDREATVAHLGQVEAVARALVAAYAPDEAGEVDFLVELLPDTHAALPPAGTGSHAFPVEEIRTRRARADQPFLDETGASHIAAVGRQGTPTRRHHASPGAVVGEAVGSGRRRHHTYRHEALFYSGEDAFLAGTVPFIQEGLALGQPIMVALPEPRLRLVRQALGSSAWDVELVDMARLGLNPARIIPAWRQFIDEDGHRGRPARGIGEPLWPGRRPAEAAECQLHEALLNLALDPGTPLWLRCPYDVDNLGAADTEGARYSHPLLVEESRERESPTYQGASLGEGMFGHALPDPPVTAEPVMFGRRTVRHVRRHVLGQALAADLDPERAADLVLAVWELVKNSIQHGGGRSDLRIWREPGALVCEVSDRGHITDPLAGRRTPGVAALGQRGIWLANQLCDLVQLRGTQRGTTVRVFSWL